MNLRRLNDQGMSCFSQFLDSLTGDSPLPYPHALLTDSASTEEICTTARIEQRTFGSRFIAAEYLFSVLNNGDFIDIDRDPGFWAWLSLLYFDQLCPPNAKGQRRPGQRPRWILIPTGRRFYRHLLAGPYQLYRAFHETPGIAIGMLCGPLDKITRVYEEVAESPTLISNPAVVEVASRLYYDPKTQKTRRNISSAGGARRFVEVLAQFDVTWDLNSLSADDIWGLLPSEFNRFMKKHREKAFSDAVSALAPNARVEP